MWSHRPKWPTREISFHHQSDGFRTDFGNTLDLSIRGLVKIPEPWFFIWYIDTRLNHYGPAVYTTINYIVFINNLIIIILLCCRLYYNSKNVLKTGICSFIFAATKYHWNIKLPHAKIYSVDIFSCIYRNDRLHPFGPRYFFFILTNCQFWKHCCTLQYTERNIFEDSY